MLFNLLLLPSAISAAQKKCYNGDVFIQLKPLDISSDHSDTFSLIRILKQGQREFKGYEKLWRKSRRSLVAARLKDHARKSQVEILKDLERTGTRHKSFWINNSIYVESPPCHLQLLLLAKFVSDGIEMMPDRIVAKIPDPIFSRSPVMDKLVKFSVMSGQLPWNLAMINLEDAWKISRGKGVVVGSIDTGVSYKHPALAENYKGKDSTDHSLTWYDPSGKTTFPNDKVGHGTHTMGTIVGKGIGVAPDAKWITARGCTEKGCNQHDLLASAQWIMCPTDAAGNENCDAGADVVSNSWGSSGKDDDADIMKWFVPVVDAWKAAGMIAVFAIGNEGPDCGTAGAPGTFANVIGVGSVNSASCLSRFSSHGPGPSASPYSSAKPDLVAPGESIISASHLNDGLLAMSGTSMACPHVSGLAALLLSLRPEADIETIRKLLVSSCNQNTLKAPSDGPPICRATHWNEFPESLHYGAGLIDAASAVKRLRRQAFVN